MKWRYTIVGFLAGVALTVVAVATFFSVKTTRNLRNGSYTFNWDREDNIFVENADQTLWANIHAWGDESTWDGISAFRVAPNGDSASTDLVLTPDGFKLSVGIKKSDEEYFLFDDNGDGFFERLVKGCCPSEVYDVTYEMKENEKYSNQSTQTNHVTRPENPKNQLDD